MATVRALSNAVEARDAYTGKHAERVTAYGLQIARTMDLPLADAPEIEFGFLLHDIGKVAIPDAILYKPGALTDEERALMAQHPGDRRRDRQRNRVSGRCGRRSSAPTTSAGTAAAIRTAWPATRDPAGRARVRGGRCVRRAHHRPPLPAGFDAPGRPSDDRGRDGHAVRSRRRRRRSARSTTQRSSRSPQRSVSARTGAAADVSTRRPGGRR